MAYTAPDPDDLQARYPAFAAVADATIQVWLTDAERYVDESWMEDDFAPAIMALAAHNMALLSLGTTTGSGAILAGVTRFKSGQMDITVADGVATRSGYYQTVYGLEFLRLLRRNFAGPRVVAAGVTPSCSA